MIKKYIKKVIREFLDRDYIIRDKQVRVEIGFERDFRYRVLTYRSNVSENKSKIELLERDNKLLKEYLGIEIIDKGEQQVYEVVEKETE